MSQCDEGESKDLYLVRESVRAGVPIGKPHIWTGLDTACRMWSTGGLNQNKQWMFYDFAPTALCRNCTSTSARGNPIPPDFDCDFKRLGRDRLEQPEKARLHYTEASGNLPARPFGTEEHRHEDPGFA